MATPSPSFGLDLGLGRLVSSARVAPPGSKQSTAAASRTATTTRRLPELRIFRFSHGCEAWSSCSGSNGDTAVLVASFLGQGRSLRSTGFGSENRSENRFCSSLHRNRIASSKSSSSSESPAVDAESESRGKDTKQYTDQIGNITKFESQSSFGESDTISGSQESKQGHVESENESADRNRSGEDVSTRISEVVFQGENGKLHGGGGVDDAQEEDSWTRERITSNESSSSSSASSTTAGPTSVGPKEPVYEVIEVSHLGRALKKIVSRRQLLRTSGLRLRDLRRVDPSLWVTNSAPALLVRDQAILLNLGSLRAVATTQEVLIFDHKSKGARSFIETLVPRLNDHQNGSVAMPFELEVIESALISRTQRLERALMDVEPRVLRLLEVLPNCMTADVLEDLRVSKQALVEVGSKAGALRQMLLELLEHPHDIRRMAIMGRVCSIGKDGISVDCVVPEDKQVAEDEEEEMEMLLEYYLQRCESTHGQAMKLLSSAKEMEDSIAVNLSSRRLEVSRLELLLQVGTFCAALGALVAGIFGMNLKSYLEERVLAFWLTTGGIVFGGISLFIYMFNYLSSRKIV